MLEHSAMYLNVTPPYEEDTSFFPDFYTSTRLGPCDLQDPVWAKMSALAGVNKKRKKSETKPQAQINKCNNEKRRREQENIYIEELAELISANFADMSSFSVKPDKCAILQETVNQIRSIKQQEGASQSSDPVQQGEVSSSRPTILSNELYGPLLLEVLEGFLFVVNSEGKVEHVTENVSTYIKFTREDILGKSIYNFIHHGDHAKFHSNLLPMIEWGSEQQPPNRSKSIDIRLLVKPPDDLDESVEEKQQRISCYELMHISSTQLRDQVSVSEEDGSDNGPCLLCIASRISHRDKTSCSVEQFTTKLDTAGKIICVDTSGVSETIAQYIKKDLIDRVLRDLVSQQDVQKINAHIRETLSAGQSTSAIYRLQIGTDKFIQVQTKSKLFKSIPHATNDSDFIMSTHSIIGENDAIGPTDPGGGTTSGGGVGGPLMTSVVNGTRNGPPVCSGGDSSTTSSNNALLNTNTTTSFTTAFNLDNDFNFDIFPTSTWELEATNWQETTRPDSRQSVTPVSTPTPRPPSNPSYSNAPTVVHSPLASHFGTQPSPTVPNPSTPANPYGSTFPFSPLNEQNYPMEEQKDTKGNVLEEAAMMADSNRLRILLTKPPNNQADSANQADKSRDRILKELLNQQDEDSSKMDNRSSPRGLLNRGPLLPGPSEPPKTSTTSGNNMLRQLLNDKSDDDDLESKAGVKKKSELLQQLLKPERDIEEEKKNDLQSQDDTLLRSLGFPPSSPPNADRGRKRSSDDKDDNPNKRSADGQVSSSGSTGSKLCERNKMLASLLAKQPTNHQPIPPIPASVLTATPQEKLPRITDPNKNLGMNMMNSNMQQNIINSRINANRMTGRSQNASYLNTVLSNNMQRNENRQINQINSTCYTSPATSSTDNNNAPWDNNNMQTCNDPLLSDILDQVIDIVPDDIMHLLDGSDGQQSNNFQTGLSETMAINIIQKSLMQCESVVKSPASPISLPGTPPAYSATSVSQNNQSNVFPPPPNYSQSKFQQRMQVRSGQPQYPGNISSQLLLQHHQRKQLLHPQQQQQQQQEQKRRLLQQQKQQQLLIPSNAAANEMQNSMQNIDSLLNNTVAPNVSLQRSASVPEPQLSPGYGGQLNQQNQRVSNQQPYSPHAQLTSPLGQQTFTQTTVGNYQNPGARLSPQAQFNSQLSPRQAYPQGNAQSTANWQQAQARLSVQQNPMLSAQLTGNFMSGGPNGRNFQRPPQQQRSLNSPGTVPTRHSPYPADQFPPPSSPNSAFNNQYLRLQRTNSAPNASTQMPGVSGSGPTSEFVRQELRAVVGARTAQTQPVTNRPQSQLMSQQQQVADLESLGINFEMAAGASDSPKLWGAMGSDMGSMSPQPATSRSSMEEGRPGDQKSSLLQKLLSE